MTLKVGTVVAVAKDLEDYDLYEGEQGVVKGFSEENNAYAVEMLTNRGSLHGCDGLVPSGRGIYLSEDELRLV